MVEQSSVSPRTWTHATAHTSETVQEGGGDPAATTDTYSTVLYNLYIHTYAQALMKASVGDETTCYVT